MNYAIIARGEDGWVDGWGEVRSGSKSSSQSY